MHDFHATIMHLLGIDHERLTYRHGGRDYRLTDVHGNVVRDILSQFTKVAFVQTDNSVSSKQLGNWPAVIHNRCRSTVEVFDQRICGINTKMMVNRGKEVASRTNTFDGILASFVSGADHPTSFNATASPDV